MPGMRTIYHRVMHENIVAFDVSCTYVHVVVRTRSQGGSRFECITLRIESKPTSYIHILTYVCLRAQSIQNDRKGCFPTNKKCVLARIALLEFPKSEWLRIHTFYTTDSVTHEQKTWQNVTSRWETHLNCYECMYDTKIAHHVRLQGITTQTELKILPCVTPKYIPQLLEVTHVLPRHKTKGALVYNNSSRETAALVAGRLILRLPPTPLL